MIDVQTLFQVSPKLAMPWSALKQMLPTVEVALFFGKIYQLDVDQLSRLLSKLFQCSVMDALMAGDHSEELQDYLVEVIPHTVEVRSDLFTGPVPQGVILPELWAAAEVTIATSIQEVADKLTHTVSHMRGVEGEMFFSHMMTLNRQRGSVGNFSAGISHKRTPANLVVLDVSGSMSRETIRNIIDDVIALSYQADAHLAIVSNTATIWRPGAYSSDEILSQAEFGGTYYETLVPVFNQDWDVVVTIADYDSSAGAKRALATATGSVDTVLDISLVNRPTYLGECVGQLAQTVKPLLVAQRSLTW